MKSPKFKIMALLSLTSAATFMVSAQTEQPKLTITPAGRILMDGAMYSPTDESFDDGVALPDVRMGLKATYGKWTGKIDIGFAQGKVGLKDIFMQYDFDSENFVRGGSFIQQYGLQTATSSSMKCGYLSPISDDAFNASRQIGIMYGHTGDEVFATVSAHVEPQASILTPYQLNEEGYGFVSRLVWHPNTEPGNIVHLGISGGYTSPQKVDDGTKGFTLTANFPTRVNSCKAVYARINDAHNMFKFTPEVVLAYNKVALQAQYFYNRINLRDDMHNYTAMGAYCNLRTLLLGDNYTYTKTDADIATPKPGSLELVLGYNYTNLSDKNAQYRSNDGKICDGIYGGRINNVSATLNYYINKYMLARLNYSYNYRWDEDGAPDMHINILQARIQIKF